MSLLSYIFGRLYTHAHLYDEDGNHLPPEEGMRGIGSHRVFRPARSAGATHAARKRVIAQHKEEMAEVEDEEVHFSGVLHGLLNSSSGRNPST